MLQIIPKRNLNLIQGTLDLKNAQNLSEIVFTLDDENKDTIYFDQSFHLANRIYQK